MAWSDVPYRDARPMRHVWWVRQGFPFHRWGSGGPPPGFFFCKYKLWKGHFGAIIKTSEKKRLKKFFSQKLGKSQWFTFFFSESYSTLVQKNLCARKALCYKFRKVSMYVHNNIFHHLSRALNLLKLISKCMEIFVQCLHPERRKIVPAPWQFQPPPELLKGSRRLHCNSDTVS